eukprot:CAMPEP_0204202604 /NCGR_PEP_ID=MMETSP0361-20130328/68342_1 /ASSEMBLY_ACC=CAM_ASM_000343 /TAXON_ID=268821 /ORGANISM="Scrippsiella Hangoei, Strain SHTV-5" /LENGTH=405 /DNA_ID=CAMNT_0051165443 /DNA_START=72 /DNA_END=1287 /DNA_ORIENTATION=-
MACSEVLAQAGSAGTTGGSGCVGILGPNTTTLMFRYIPRKYTGDDLMAEVQVYASIQAFDFVYVPWDRHSTHNMGFGFVNFLEPAAAHRIRDLMNDTFWLDDARCRRMSIFPARLQGLEANLTWYNDSNVGDPDFAHCPKVLSQGVHLLLRTAIETYCAKPRASALVSSSGTPSEVPTTQVPLCFTPSQMRPPGVFVRPHLDVRRSRDESKKLCAPTESSNGQSASPSGSGAGGTGAVSCFSRSTRSQSGRQSGGGPGGVGALSCGVGALSCGDWDSGTTAAEGTASATAETETERWTGTRTSFCSDSVEKSSLYRSDNSGSTRVGSSDMCEIAEADDLRTSTGYVNAWLEVCTLLDLLAVTVPFDPLSWVVAFQSVYRDSYTAACSWICCAASGHPDPLRGGIR